MNENESILQIEPPPESDLHKEMLRQDLEYIKSCAGISEDLLKECLKCMAFDEAARAFNKRGMCAECFEERYLNINTTNMLILEDLEDDKSTSSIEQTRV